MAAARGVSYQEMTAHLAAITTSSPATPSTQNTTPSWTQDWRTARERIYTSLITLASNAPTSSNTQGLDESLSAPETWIEAALNELRSTLTKKNEDYRIDGEFSNFEMAASLASLLPEDVIMVQLGIKLGRLKGLADEPHNESKLDTYKDLAGYAIIAYAYAMKVRAGARDEAF